MQVAEQLDSVTIERPRKQGEFLLRIYQAEIARDATSHGSEASRSNVIAMQHTVRQMYGEAVARDVANLITANLAAKHTEENLLKLWATHPITQPLKLVGWEEEMRRISLKIARIVGVQRFTSLPPRLGGKRFLSFSCADL